MKTTQKPEFQPSSLIFIHIPHIQIKNRKQNTHLLVFSPGESRHYNPAVGYNPIPLGTAGGLDEDS